MIACERCGKDCFAPRTGGDCEWLWTWRDPVIPRAERYRGHGVLSVCAECLHALGGPDYRGLSVGQVLGRFNEARRR